MLDRTLKHFQVLNQDAHVGKFIVITMLIQDPCCCVGSTSKSLFYYITQTLSAKVASEADRNGWARHMITQAQAYYRTHGLL